MLKKKRFFEFCHQAPNAQKKYPKIHFRCKLSRYIEFRRQNWPKYRGKAGKSKKSLHFWKMHKAINAKTLNLLKIGRGRKLCILSNGILFRMATGGYGIMTDVFPRFSAVAHRFSVIFCYFPDYPYIATQFWAQI